MPDAVTLQEQKTADLFEYLKSILFTSGRYELDLDSLPENEKKLGMGLIQLNEYMKEEKSFAEGLSKGDFSTPLPASDNPLTGELRDLHGALSHLVWQAEQVSKGDYSQKLDFMGSLSVVFNDMVEALADREDKLQHEAEVIQRQNERLRQGQVLYVKLMGLMEDWVIVSDRESGKIYHVNKSCKDFMNDKPDVYKTLSEKLRQICASSEKSSEATHCSLSLEVDTSSNRVMEFEVSSLSIGWDKHEAVVNILHDVTREREIEFYAYHDSLTGIYNRRYAIEELSHNFAEKKKFQIGFVDIDGLKFVNDELGHEVGNVYIEDLIRVLDKVSGPKTLCRVGGDEFLVISYSDENLEWELDDIRNEFIGESVVYLQSFSYGVTESAKYDNDLSPMINVSAMLEDADSIMYRYKVRNKEERRI